MKNAEVFRYLRGQEVTVGETLKLFHGYLMSLYYSSVLQYWCLQLTIKLELKQLLDYLIDQKINEWQ